MKLITMDECAQDTASSKHTKLMETDCDELKLKNGSNEADANTETETKLSRSEKLMLLPRLMVFVFMFMCYASLPPFFPPEAASKGVRSTVIGLIFSIYPGIMVISSPIVGMLMPKIGSRIMFATGTAITGSAYIILSLISKIEDRELFIASCFIIRAFEGIGASCVITSYFSSSMEYYTQHINYVFALQQIFIGIGSSIGPVLGQWLYTIGGFMSPFLVFGLLLYTSVPFLLFCTQPTIRQPLISRRRKNVNIFSLLQCTEVIVASIVVITSGTFFGFLNPTLEPFVQQTLNLTPAQIALLFPVFGGTYAVTCFVWSHLVTLVKKESYFMLFGIFSCGVIFLLMGPSPLFDGFKMKLWLLIVLLVFLGVFSSMHLVPTLEFMKKGAIRAGYDDDLTTYGLISGIWSAAISIGYQSPPERSSKMQPRSLQT